MKSVIFDWLNEYKELISQAERYSDKIAIFVYAMSGPIHFIYKKLGIKYDHKFYKNITLSYDGVKFFCGNGVSYAKVCRKGFEENFLDNLNILSGTFIDIGGHIGKYSIKIGKKLGEKGKVLVVEPTPSNLELLKKNIELNHLNNIIVEEVACSNKNDNKTFFISNNMDEGSAGSSFYIKDNMRPIKVKCRKLDTLVKKNNLKDIKLIKIDVEGAEAEVLQGSKKTIIKYKPQIIFEAWNKEYLDKAARILNKLGYSIKTLDAENYLAEYTES